jgi:hypothetical protein
MAASALAAGASDVGCLLNKTPVPDDADLHPPSPPVLLEEQTQPPPGQIVLLDRSRTYTFSATIATASTSVLKAKWWVNRARPCDPSMGDCGEQPVEDLVPANPTGSVRMLSPQTFRFDLSHVCYSVDLYVSSEFQFGTVQAHLPSHPGDLAHARWYVVKLDAPSDAYMTQLSGFLASCPP